MLPFTFLLAAAALLLDGVVFIVGFETPPQHEVASYVLLGLCFAGWPCWRYLSPRPIHALRAIAAVAGWVGLCLTWTCIIDRDPARHGYAMHAYGLVALAVYAEIAAAILDRRDHGSAFVPRMRWLRRGAASSLRSHAGSRARRADRSDPSYRSDPSGPSGPSGPSPSFDRCTGRVTPALTDAAPRALFP